MWPPKSREIEVEINSLNTNDSTNYSVLEGSIQTQNNSQSVQNDQDLNEISPKAQDLIDAAKECDAERVYKILKTGVSPNVVDEHGKTPLHYAVNLECHCSTCGENAENCLRVLLQFSEIDIDIQDNKGLTPLHIAADNQFEKCVQGLVCKGANIYKMSHAGEQAIMTIAKRTPDVMLHILNFSISLDGYPKSEKCVVNIDFRPILGQDGQTNKSSAESSASRRCRSRRKNNELDLLRSLLTLSKENRRKLLTHPAVSVFLQQKWRRISRQFWATSICYIFWVLLYTSYIVKIYLIKCPCRLYHEENNNHKNLTNSSSALSDQEVREQEIAECLKSFQVDVSFCVLVVLTTIMILYEITKIVVTPKWYFQSVLNILHWTLFVLVIVTFIPTMTKQSSIANEQYQLAAVAIFLTWSLILAQIAKFPMVGEYMEIFGHVLNHFLCFLLTNISLFIGFALAFCILFPGNTPYTVFPFAFLKIFVMMIGELEYQEMFYTSNNGVSGPVVGHLLYVTFVIVVTIILMNLLVGLTVSDIRGLQKEAKLSRVSRQIMDMFHLECFLFSKKIPRIIKTNCRKLTTVVPDETPISSIQDPERRFHDSNGHGQPLITNKYIFRFRPNDPLDKAVPERLKLAALELAVQVMIERKEKICRLKKWSMKKFQFNSENDVEIEAKIAQKQPLISNF